MVVLTELNAQQDCLDDERIESLKQNPRGEFLQAIRVKDLVRCLVKTAEIHGHFCPGSALGVMASVYGLNMLGLDSISSDGLEDLMAVVEINACFADGVQAVSGCTLGNNALVYRDLGRLAVTFAIRGKETGVRIRVRPDFSSCVARAAPEFYPLLEKVITNREGGAKEKAAFRNAGRQAAFSIIKLPFEELFAIETVQPILPEYAPITQSVVCSNCGEMIMASKAVDGLCLMCAGGVYHQVEGKGIVSKKNKNQCDGRNRQKKGKSSFWMQDPELVFGELNLKEGDCFLDLGCGPGDYSIRASEVIGAFGTVYALDKNQDSIVDLNNRVVSGGLKNIKAEVCDIAGPLPVKDSCVDICFISTVLHSFNLTDVEKNLFGEVRRVLKPSGRLAIIECKKEVQPCGPPIDVRISPEELEGTITQYGFEKLSLNDLGYNYLIQFKKTSENLPVPCGQIPGDIVLHPVGIIKNKFQKPFLVAGGDGLKMQGDLKDAFGKIDEALEEISNIIIDEGVAGILDGIEEYSHIIILYWAHKVPEVGRLLIWVHPMGREDIPQRGIFCTCSPARPNPVLMTVVRLKGRKGNVLEVLGLDAVDGSPVIDIKPYVKDFCPQEGVRIPKWMQQLQEEVSSAKSRKKA